MDNNKKIFISDLDGTLLTTDKRVTPKTKQVLADFVAAGNHFAISTGRDINSALSVYESLGLDLPGSFIIAYNGSQIYDYDKKETLYRLGIKKETVKALFELGKEMGIHLQTYTDRFILSPHVDECLVFYRRVIKTPMIAADDIFPYLDVEPCKLLAIELHDPEKLEAFRKKAQDSFCDIKTVYSSSYYLEMIDKNAGKGEAVGVLSNITGIPVSDIYAAGDEKNDVTMLKAAGIGIAMINGTEEAKAAADIITKKDNDNDGLAEVLATL